MRRTHWLILLAVGLIECVISVGILRGAGIPQSDFANYYGAAQALLRDRHANIYLAHTLHTAACGPDTPVPYIYLPAFALLLLPLGMLPCAAAATVWQVLTAGMLLLTLALLQDLWPQRTRTFAALCAATAICPPLLFGFWYGQIHVLVLFGVVLALWCGRRGHAVAAGGVIGVVSLIQLMPGVIVACWLLRRDWRQVSGALAAGAVGLGVMVVVTGPQGLSEWLAAGQQRFALFQTPINASPLIHFGVWLPALLALSYVLVLVRARPEPLVAYLWTLASVLVLSPVVWAFLLIWLLPIWWYWWAAGRRVVAVISYGLASAATIAAIFAPNIAPRIELALLIGTWLALAETCARPLVLAFAPAWRRRAAAAARTLAWRARPARRPPAIGAADSSAPGGR